MIVKIDKEKFINEFYKIKSYNQINNCITFFKKILYFKKNFPIEKLSVTLPFKVSKFKGL